MVVKSRSELVDMQGIPPRDDGVQLVGGRVGGGGGGGGGVSYRWNRLRPAFMEPLVGSPPRDGVALQLNKRKRSSSFPLKDDAGYIGYLTDDDEDNSGSSGSSGSGDQGEGDMMKIVDRRRRELIGPDISFSGCMFMMITVCGLLMLFLFAASPWGVPPPRRL